MSETFQFTTEHAVTSEKGDQVRFMFSAFSDRDTEDFCVTPMQFGAIQLTTDRPERFEMFKPGQKVRVTLEAVEDVAQGDDSSTAETASSSKEQVNTPDVQTSSKASSTRAS